MGVMDDIIVIVVVNNGSWLAESCAPSPAHTHTCLRRFYARGPDDDRGKATYIMQAIDGWYGESSGYDWSLTGLQNWVAAQNRRSTIAHFTQVVWKSTVSIG